MGRVKRTVVRRVGTNRREFFRRAGGAAFALGAASLLQACGGGGGDDDEPAPPTPASGTFGHGVASGDPLSDRVILWTRVTPASEGSIAVDCVVASDAALANVVARVSLTTDATRDYTVKTDVAGLEANTTYYYCFSTASAQSPIGRTRTLPVGTATHLRMAVVSCSSLAHGFFNAYRRIAERADLDLVVHLGDYIYEYGNGEFGNARAYEPAVETITLSDYRTRHAQYKREADLQELHRQHPMIAIWDDHEVADNSNVDGAVNHTEGAEGTWTARVANALQAYYEWMPVRVVDAGNPRKNNRSFAYGNLVDLLMLEERYAARSPQLQTITGTTGIFTQSGAFTDASRQMLGSEEEDWLATRLRASTAQWKFVGQGVMFAQLKVQPQSNADGGGRFINTDQWDGYQPARDRVYEVLKGNASSPAVGNVVVLSGDAHSSWAADLTQDPNNSDIATGGYDPATGAGSRAVEFVGTSVTSPPIIDTGLAEPALKEINPHFKYIDLSRRGYMLLDADVTRVVSEWWYVDTIANPSSGQSFGAAFQVQDGTNRLTPAAQTSPRSDPPALAP
jgi:alkaline phosphatase D